MLLSVPFFLVFLFSFLLQVSVIFFFRQYKYIYIYAISLVYLLTSLAFSVLGYCSHGTGRVDNDYRRIISEISLSQAHGLSFLLGNSYQTSPLSGVYLYLIGKTGDYELVKFVSVFIFMTCLFYASLIMQKICLSPYAVTFALALVISSLDFTTGLLSNIRFCLGSSVLLVGLIRLTFIKRNRPLSLLFVVCACMFHIGLSLIVLVYLICILLAKKSDLLTFVLCGLGSAFVPILAKLLIPYIGGMATKVWLYFSEDQVNTSYTPKLMFYYKLIVVFVFIFSFMSIKKINNASSSMKSYTSLSFYRKFVVSLSIFAFVYSFVSFTFTYYAMIISFVAVPIVSCLFTNYSNNDSSIDSDESLIRAKSKNTYLLFLFIGFVVFIIASLFFRCYFTYMKYSVNILI